jgi:hypothetical protein
MWGDVGEMWARYVRDVREISREARLLARRYSSSISPLFPHISPISPPYLAISRLLARRLAALARLVERGLVALGRLRVGLGVRVRVRVRVRARARVRVRVRG